MSNNDENIRQTFSVTLTVTALTPHTVNQVRDALASQMVLLPNNMHLDGVAVMQTSEYNTATEDFLCYDITTGDFTPERPQGVDPHTPWTEHVDHDQEEHLS